MDDFKDIKQLWDSENTLDIPQLEQIQILVRKYQNKKERTVLLLIAILILCGVLFALVFIFHRPLLWTTSLGEILMASGIIVGLITKLNTLKKISANELKSNKDYLKYLIKGAKRKKLKTNWLVICSMLLIAFGYGFFIYENIRDSQTELILCYLGIALFTGIIYFIFRPFVKRISKNKTKEMLEKIKRLN